ncbi:sigma-70 family RNA polymerase sigma factor [Sphingomonas sp. YL-JM2C]
MNIRPAPSVRQDADQAKDGEPTGHSGFADLYRRELPRLRRFFRSKVRNPEDAIDLAHEALTRFLAKSGPTTISSPGGYLTRIATNLVLDRAKRGSTKLADITHPIDEALDAASDLDLHRQVELRQEAEHWRAILSLLPPLTLDVFLLNRNEGYTYAEVAARLDISVWRVQKQMQKALRHIEAHSDRDDA